jgi:hypothetical protein
MFVHILKQKASQQKFCVSFQLVELSLEHLVSHVFIVFVST